LKTNPKVFFAGQITGVEGYMESCMSGLIAAKSLMRRYENKESIVPDEYTMIGSLLNYITTKKQDFQPMHASFSLVPPLNERIRNKKERKAAYTKRAVENIKEYIIQLER
jgi:methylenetetrahydrofolate--tRNA-(uracil-5-)-methyltransferase